MNKERMIMYVAIGVAIIAIAALIFVLMQDTSTMVREGGDVVVDLG
jgi:hypothetical protein